LISSAASTSPWIFAKAVCRSIDTWRTIRHFWMARRTLMAERIKTYFNSL
jgi:hypothetical protein